MPTTNQLAADLEALIASGEITAEQHAEALAFLAELQRDESELAGAA